MKGLELSVAMDTVSATCPQEGALYLLKGRLAAVMLLFRKRIMEKGQLTIET